MWTSIFFPIAFVILLFGMVFAYKVPKKISLLRSIVISFITELCFGAVVAEFYSLLCISICLLSMGMAYLLLGSIIWLVIIKQRRMQAVFLDKTDIYASLVIGIGFLIIFLNVFTPNISNVYINSDPAIHYSFALNVLDTGKISNMYFAELYNGLILEMFQPFMARLNLYKAFIIADSCANLINIFMFYVFASTICKSRLGKIIAPFLSLLYFMGWPFFSYALGGFVYYGWGVTLFAYVVFLLIQLYESENKRNQITLILLVLCGCFSTLVCYMLFVPVLSAIVLVCFFMIWRKNKKVISKKLNLCIIISVLLGGIIIYEVSFLGFFDGDSTYIFSALKTDGWIHKDLYRDFYILIPPVLYMGWYYFKNRKMNFVSISTNILLIYILITFIGCFFDLISPYYYYKPYYILWFFTWLMCLDGMEYFLKHDRAIAFIYCVMVVFPMIMTLSGIDAKLEKKGIVYDEAANRHYPSLMPILDRNEYFLSKEERDLEDRDSLLEVSDYVNSKLSNKGDRIPLITSDGCVENWYKSFTGKESICISSGEEMKRVLSECKKEGFTFIVIHQNTQVFRNNKSLLDNFENVYDNGFYGIYEIIYEK